MMSLFGCIAGTPSWLTCNPPCKNGGVCIGKNKCHCSPGYKGVACQNGENIGLEHSKSSCQGWTDVLSFVIMLILVQFHLHTEQCAVVYVYREILKTSLFENKCYHTTLEDSVPFYGMFLQFVIGPLSLALQQSAPLPVSLVLCVRSQESALVPMDPGASCAARL